MQDPGINGKHDITDITENHHLENPGPPKKKHPVYALLAWLQIEPLLIQVETWPNRCMINDVCVCARAHACVRACVRAFALADTGPKTGEAPFHTLHTTRSHTQRRKFAHSHCKESLGKIAHTHHTHARTHRHTDTHSLTDTLTQTHRHTQAQEHTHRQVPGSNPGRQRR